MCRTRSERYKKERILGVVLYSDLGLCIEFGDEELDEDGIHGYAPNKEFIEALRKEFRSHVENTIGGLDLNPTLKNVYERLQKVNAHQEKDGWKLSGR